MIHDSYKYAGVVVDVWLEATNMKEQLIKEFNKLGIADMEEVKELHEGKGSFVNLEFPIPSGQSVKLWDDNKTYYINQIEKAGGARCYGLVADEKYLLVCEYGVDGADAEIIVFKRWN